MVSRGQKGRACPRVDVVVVAYRSARVLREAVRPLAGLDWVNVIVVDNDSPDRSVETVEDLPIAIVRAGRNGGFAAGCNVGVAAGDAPYVLLLNPDARIDARSLARLVGVLERDPNAGIAGPLIRDEDGRLAFSQRRFPRLRSTYAQALFLHRLLPLATWTDELVRDPAAYRVAGSPEWLSGACLLARRTLLAALGGLDERYFHYIEDTDLCLRARRAGWDLRFEPSAVVMHAEGHAAPREHLLGLLARNRVLYARRHAHPAAARLEAAGVALGHAVRAVGHARRPRVARGHIEAVRAAVRPLTPLPRPEGPRHCVLGPATNWPVG